MILNCNLSGKIGRWSIIVLYVMRKSCKFLNLFVVVLLIYNEKFPFFLQFQSIWVPTNISSRWGYKSWWVAGICLYLRRNFGVNCDNYSCLLQSSYMYCSRLYNVRLESSFMHEYLQFTSLKYLMSYTLAFHYIVLGMLPWNHFVVYLFKLNC